MIEFYNVYKSFDKEILSNLSFKLKDCEKLGIFGKSGVGKSTIIDLLLNFEKPTKGTINKNFSKASVVFQQDRLIDEISAFDNLFILSDDTKEIIYTLKLFGINDYKKKVSKLSGGMRRRVAIARSYIYNGDILILDEAFQGLDYQNKITASKLLNKRFKDKTIIVISHDKSDFDLFDIDENIIYL